MRPYAQSRCTWVSPELDPSLRTIPVDQPPSGFTCSSARLSYLLMVLLMVRLLPPDTADPIPRPWGTIKVRYVFNLSTASHEDCVLSARAIVPPPLLRFLSHPVCLNGAVYHFLRKIPIPEFTDTSLTGQIVFFSTCFQVAVSCYHTQMPCLLIENV